MVSWIKPIRGEGTANFAIQYNNAFARWPTLCTFRTNRREKVYSVVCIRVPEQQDSYTEEVSLTDLTKSIRHGVPHRVHILVEMKQSQCICPLSWSVHCNFTGEGKCSERGWACTPTPHQPGLISPSWLNVRQKAAVATLCTLWCSLPWLKRPEG